MAAVKSRHVFSPSLPELIRIVSLAATLSAATGCSASYVDNDGATHIVGLVDMVVACPPHVICNNAVSFESIGLSYLRSAPGDALSVGYTKDTVISIPDNTIVVLRKDR